MSQSRLSVLQADPLFNNALLDMQQRMDSYFLTERASTMTILESAAPTAAILCKEMVEFGTLDEEAISLNKRIDSIWDILDRTGNKAPDKRLIGHLDLGSLIADAYEKKHRKDKDNGNGETEDIASRTSESGNGMRQQGSMNADANAEPDVEDAEIVDGSFEMLPVAI